MTINADIDRIFKDGLQDHSPKVPAYIWDHIEQNLDHRKNRNRRTFIYSIAASVAILIAFGTGFLITERQSNNTIEKNSIAVVDSTLNKEQSESEQVQPLANDEDALKSNEINKDEKVSTDKANQEPKQEQKVKTKAKKATSSGTLLPPMFGKVDSMPVADTIKKDSMIQPVDTINME